VFGQLDAKMEQPTQLAFTLDGKNLVAVSQLDCQARIWDLAQRKLLHTLGPGPRGGSLALSPDGKTIAAGNDPRVVQLWDMATGKQLFTEDQGNTSFIRALVYAPEGKALVSGGDREVVFWDTASGKRAGILPGGAHTLSFSPDGTQLARVGNYRDDSNVWFTSTVRVWNVAASKETLAITIPDEVTAPQFIPMHGVVKSAFFSTDGRKLLTLDWHGSMQSGIGGNSVRVWDAATGKEDRVWTSPPQQNWISSLVADGKTILSMAEGERISIHDIESGRKRLLPGPAHEFMASSDARIVATGRPNSFIKLWEVMTGKEIFLLKGHEAAVYALAWSPNGRLLASGDFLGYSPTEIVQTVRLWDTATGKELARFDGQKGVLALAFSPDGTKLATGLVDAFDDCPIMIWEVGKFDPRLAPAPRLGQRHLESYWTDLAGGNAAKAHGALWAMVASPTDSVPFLRDRLKPVVVADQGKIEQWLADLGSDKFSVRQAATKELEKVGEQVQAHIRNH
jgi:WD40 repeat protein